MFVHKYLSDWETLLLFASLEDEEDNRPVNFSFSGEIMSAMDTIFHQLCKDRNLDWSKDSFVQGFLLADEKTPQYYTSPPSYSTNSFHPTQISTHQSQLSTSPRSDLNITVTNPSTIGTDRKNNPLSDGDEEELTPKMGTTAISSTNLESQTQQHPHPFKRQFSSDINLVMNLESLCLVLSKYDHSHTLYAIAHGIRRLG